MVGGRINWKQTQKNELQKYIKQRLSNSKKLRERLRTDKEQDSNQMRHWFG